MMLGVKTRNVQSRSVTLVSISSDVGGFNDLSQITVSIVMTHWSQADGVLY